MERFRFRLESVRKWRHLELELEEAKLQGLFTELRGLEAHQAALAAGKAEAERSVLTAKTVPAQQLAALDDHRQWVATQQALLAHRVAGCNARIVAQRERVRKAEQNLELLNRLKQRRLTEWSAEVDKEYQTLAEEAFLAGWRRR
jgi:hypothetical protein